MHKAITLLFTANCMAPDRCKARIRLRLVAAHQLLQRPTWVLSAAGAGYMNNSRCFLYTWRHILSEISLSPMPVSQHSPTLASWHPCVFSCQPSGSPPGSSRPSILITFQQTGQFVGPNPLHHKGHNGSYSGPLSSRDLLLPSGRPHFLIEESAWTDRF